MTLEYEKYCNLLDRGVGYMYEANWTLIILELIGQKAQFIFVPYAIAEQ